MALAVGALGLADLPSDRRAVLLSSHGAVRHADARSASPAQDSVRDARPADAATALPANELGRRRGRHVRAGPRRAHGSPRRADIGQRVRRCRRPIPSGRDRAACGGRDVDEPRTSGGEELRADQFVFACGPWLPKVFPQVLGSRIFPTRQEVFFFAPASGDARFEPGQLPGWADFNEGDIYYGFPDLEARGFKIAHDQHGPRDRPDVGDRTMSESGQGSARVHAAAFSRAGRSASGRIARVPVREQFERRPAHRSTSDVAERLAGRCGLGARLQARTGRGEYAAQRVLNASLKVEPRFSLQTKATEARRDVH